MITLSILAAILIGLAVFAGLGGAAVIFMFGDIIVCVGILAYIIKRLIDKRG